MNKLRILLAALLAAVCLASCGSKHHRDDDDDDDDDIDSCTGPRSGYDRYVYRDTDRSTSSYYNRYDDDDNRYSMDELSGSWRSDVYEDGENLTMFINLYSDGTVELMVANEYKNVTANGTWYVDGDDIFMNTDNGGRQQFDIEDFTGYSLTLENQGETFTFYRYK